MDPPAPLSPNKMPFSPGMPIFPASPDRSAGTTSKYGGSQNGSPVMSPSTPTLRPNSPLRHTHRRTDSDVSVTALTGMFENLEVKDPREACKRFKELLDKERIRNTEKLNKIAKEHAKKEKEHEMALSRRDMRIDELKSELEHASGSLDVAITKERYEKERKANKAAINQWETVFKQNEERWKNMQHKMVSLACWPPCGRLLTYTRLKRRTRAKSTKANTEATRSNGWKQTTTSCDTRP